MAERVVACWLQVSFYDSQVAQTREYTPAQGRMLQQQLDGAHRHYLAAIKTLATVRKLLKSSRSPVEIASKLAGERSGLRLRQVPGEAGVPGQLRAGSFTEIEVYPVQQTWRMRSTPAPVAQSQNYNSQPSVAATYGA